MTTKLTRYERQVLINQFEIRKGRQPQEAKYFDGLIEILRCGYEGAYDDVFECDAEVVTEEQCLLVLHVLDMYRSLHYFETQHANEWAAFADHSFAHFVVERQGKFAEQIPRMKDTDGFNSHYETLGTYRRMVATWTALDHKYKLTRDDVARLLA